MTKHTKSLRSRRSAAAELPPLTIAKATPLTALADSPLTDPLPYIIHLPTENPISGLRCPIAHPPSAVPPFFTLEARINPGIWGPRLIFYPHMTTEADAALVFDTHPSTDDCPPSSTKGPYPSVRAFWDGYLDPSLRRNIPPYPNTVAGSFGAFEALLKDIALPGDLRDGRLSLPTQMAVQATLGVQKTHCWQFDRAAVTYCQEYQEQLGREATLRKKEAVMEEEARMRSEIYNGRDGMDWGSEDGDNEVNDEVEVPPGCVPGEKERGSFNFGFGRHLSNAS